MTKLGPDFYTWTWDRIKGDLDPRHYDANWEVAINGIEGRFIERFVKPADAIQELDRLDDKNHSAYPEGRGFALAAIDCLLLESLHGYETGKRTKGKNATSNAFESVLTQPPFKEAFDQGGRAKTFAGSVRNGLLHDGETRDGWLIWQGEQNGPIVEPHPDGKRLVLYRDAFHENVKRRLSRYFASLRDAGAQGEELRKNFITRVIQLRSESEPP